MTVCQPKYGIEFRRLPAVWWIGLPETFSCRMELSTSDCQLGKHYVTQGHLCPQFVVFSVAFATKKLCLRDGALDTRHGFRWCFWGPWVEWWWTDSHFVQKNMKTSHFLCAKYSPAHAVQYLQLYQALLWSNRTAQRFNTTAGLRNYGTPRWFYKPCGAIVSHTCVGIKSLCGSVGSQ